MITKFLISNFSLRQNIKIFGWFSSKNRLRNQLVILFCFGANSLPIYGITWKMNRLWLSRTWNMRSKSNFRAVIPRNITQTRYLNQMNVTWETVINCQLKDPALLSQVFFLKLTYFHRIDFFVTTSIINIHLIVIMLHSCWSIDQVGFSTIK